MNWMSTLFEWISKWYNDRMKSKTKFWVVVLSVVAIASAACAADLSKSVPKGWSEDFAAAQVKAKK